MDPHRMNDSLNSFVVVNGPLQLKQLEASLSIQIFSPGPDQAFSKDWSE